MLAQYEVTLFYRETDWSLQLAILFNGPPKARG